jgi:MFS transporter, DHA1 family, multidrug resistance protein
MGTAEFVTLVSIILALNALAIDTMLPAFDHVRAHFGLPSDSTAPARIVTVFFLGSALQLFHGPLADRFGRKPVLFLGALLYGSGAVASVLAPDFGWMLVARFVWGFGAAALQVSAIAMVRDRFSGDRMARVMSLIMGVFAVVPVAAPLLGAVILERLSWQAVFVFPAVFVVVIALWSLRLVESLPESARSSLDLAQVVRTTRMVASNRVTAGHTLALTLVFGGFTSYLASSELIVGGIYGRPDAFPFVFASVALIMGAVSFTNASAVQRWGARAMVRNLLAASTIVGSALAVMSVSAGGVPPFWPFLAVLVAGIALFPAISSSLTSLALEPMGRVAGMASAVVGTTYTAGGAILGAVIDGLLVGTVTPLAVGLASGGAGGLLLVRWARRPAGPPATPAGA